MKINRTLANMRTQGTRGMVYALAMLFGCLAQPALPENVIYRFNWDGANGYRLEGALSFDRTQSGPLVREGDVTCFEISGFKDETPLGRWNLSMLLPDTPWRLNFFAPESRFLVEGDGAWMPQAWNMRGDGAGCGKDGFGFNLGNIAQDICLNDQVVIASQIDPFQPFPAERVQSHTFGAGACHGPMLLGALD